MRVLCSGLSEAWRKPARSLFIAPHEDDARKNEVKAACGRDLTKRSGLNVQSSERSLIRHCVTCRSRLKHNSARRAATPTAAVNQMALAPKRSKAKPNNRGAKA